MRAGDALVWILVKREVATVTASMSVIVHETTPHHHSAPARPSHTALGSIWGRSGKPWIIDLSRIRESVKNATYPVRSPRPDRGSIGVYVVPDLILRETAESGSSIAMGLLRGAGDARDVVWYFREVDEFSARDD